VDFVGLIDETTMNSASQAAQMKTAAPLIGPAQWTVVRIVSGGGGRGRGEIPPPPPDAPEQSQRFSWRK